MSTNQTQVFIYDTTLRDGTQGEGVSFSVGSKLRVAEKLDQFGIDYIEGGWPGSNPRDMAFFDEVRNLELKHAKISAFGSTRRAGVKAEDDAQLKLGHCHRSMGNLGKAREEYKRLIDYFPGSEFYEKARESLKQLNAQ